MFHQLFAISDVKTKEIDTILIAVNRRILNHIRLKLNARLTKVNIHNVAKASLNQLL